MVVIDEHNLHLKRILWNSPSTMPRSRICGSIYISTALRSITEGQGLPHPTCGDI
jgi:hypothetical protein